ncbi:hypothetical protein C9J12_25970 [Photobacterium frigidiphilum]|uniref:Uncharacterized protein n=1 Tax=Photobacterium frigidiphilum TaxID=264736 RepID=A0A2T3J7K5_9GAMM|nr:hypothetical protein [Photobacterium frigidiphilum]PSU44747.1 hypothetical protein C9J12_25970 [Photobacterium frigidiphilum]
MNQPRDNDTGGGKYATEDHWRAMPNLSVRGRYSFTEKVSLPIKTQYQWWDNDNYLYAEVGINYKLNPAWDIGLMYGYSDTT